MRAPASWLFSLLALAGAGQAAAAGMFFCCVDETGKQVCGDILPSACYGRAYRELNESGRTLRQIEAPLNAEQRAQRAAEEARRKEREDILREQRRKERALLDTYATEKDIQALRQRAEQDINKSIQAAEEKIAEAQLSRKKFEDEAEFYKKKQIPAEIEKGLRDADYAIKVQIQSIASKKKELEEVRRKYDEDLRNFLELMRRPAVR